MTPFIVICALLVAAAVLLLVWPLLRTPPASSDPPRSRAAIAATTVAALLPLVAIAAYFWASNWDWRAETAAPQTPQAPDIARMIGQLRDRLARAPEDVEGWKLLGRSATVTGDYVLAREAFGEAYTRTQGKDAAAIVGYAESLVLNDEREIDGQAAQLFEQALALDPDNARALWYGGIVAYRRGDMALAQQRWIELQNHQLPPELSQLLAERLADLEIRTGSKPQQRPATSSGQPAVSLVIRLDAALAAGAPLSAPLFVIARRGDAGPPLAVVKRSVAQWPVTVTLSDADAMLPGVSIKGGGPIRVIARIALSGTPTAQSGDLYGEVGYDFTATEPVPITIDRVVP